MKIIELMSKCTNCDYAHTTVIIWFRDGSGLRCVPDAVPEWVKLLDVRNFTLGKIMEHGRLSTLEITIEGRKEA